MRRLFKLLLFFLLLYFPSHAQNTSWVKTLSYDTGGSTWQRHDSSSIGPYEMVCRTDGKYYVLCNDNQDGLQSLYLIDSLGHANSSPVGSYLTLQYWRAYGLAATPNNSCVYIEYHNDWGGYSAPEEWSLMKTQGTSATALHTWSKIAGVGDVLYAVVPNYHNGYYCHVNNVWIDYPIGDTINFQNASKVFANDDILFNYNTQLDRKDTNGIVIWTIQLNGAYFIGCDETILYTIGDSIRKYNSIDGSLIWTRSIPSNLPSVNMSLQSGQQGIICKNGRYIAVLDSSGFFVDEDSINFTYYTPNNFITTSDGSILIGGSFKSGDPGNLKGYSPVLIKLNKYGRGVVDSTFFHISGDADMDQVSKFADDAVVIAAAFGQSGIRDVNSGPCNGNLTYSSYWSTSFPSGINYRLCDSNQDGTIDSTDLNCGFTPNPYSYFSHSSPSGEQIKVIADNYNPMLGDSFNLYVILGDSLNPIDSIYGISLITEFHSYTQSMPIWGLTPKDGVIGNIGSNLFFNAPYSYPNVGAVLCRTDHTNTTFISDTILTAKAMFTYSAGPGPWPPSISVNAHMITKDGYTVPLNSVQYYFSSTVGVNEQISNRSFRIYPNPVDAELKIEGVQKGDKIQLFNLLGECVFEKISSDEKFILETSNLVSGIYTVRVNSSYTNRFVKL